MPTFVHVHLRDANSELIEKVMRLYERPGSPGEKAAAASALKRMGVSMPAEPIGGGFIVWLESKYPGHWKHDSFITAASETEAIARAKRIASQKFPSANEWNVVKVGRL